MAGEKQLICWNESLDPAAAYTEIAATGGEQSTFATGDVVYPPEGLTQIIGYGCAIDQTVASEARIRSPKLVERGHEEYVPRKATGLTFGTPMEWNDRSQNPIPLEPNDPIRWETNSNPAAAAQHYAGILLSDGPVTPVRGNIQTIRVTAAVSIVVTGWTNGALTFPVDLKAGRYQVVGARCQSTNGVFFRLVPAGGKYRCGGPCVNAAADLEDPIFRNGNLGVWFEFDSRVPPTIDVLGVTDTTQIVYLDLIKVA